MDLQFFESLQWRSNLIHKDKEGDDILQRLASLIHGDESQKRFALCVLNLILKHCDQEVFEENAPSWMRFSMQVINMIPSDNLIHLCFSCLGRLLQLASNNDKLARDIATKAMDPLLILLVGNSLPLSAQKIDMIKCCIINFSGPCGQHRSSILKVVVSAIESDDYLACSSACEMYTLLATCGAGGEKKNRFVENWVNQIEQVINTLHLYITKLSSKICVVDEKAIGEQVDYSKLIAFSEISENVELDTAKISSRIERLLLMLQYIVGTAMSFEVPFPLLKLINLFCELSNMLSLELKGIEGFELVIIKISEALLRCLDVTLNQFKTMLIPFSLQVAKILTAMLTMSDSVNRTNVYRCMLSMLDSWKAYPPSMNIIDNMIKNIFKDIKIQGNGSDYIHSQKNHTMHTFSQSKKEIHQFNYMACQNTYSALKVLEKIIDLNGPLLSVDNMNSIVANILDIFVKLYARDGFLLPYTCADNRLMTFRIAKCLLTLWHGSVQFPISILLSFFNAGTTELDDGIRSYCTDVLLQYDCVLHPINPGFNNNTCNGSVEHSLNNNGNHSEAYTPLEPPSRKNIEMKQEETSPSTMRLCNSADQVLVKEACPKVIQRSNSEPVIYQKNAPTSIQHNNNNKNDNNNTSKLHVDILSPIISTKGSQSLNIFNTNVEDDTKVEDNEYGDGPVVISDSSEEDCPPRPRLFEPAPPRNGETMYSPRSKKTKLNSGDGNGFQESDGEFVAILDTFCENDADD